MVMIMTSAFAMLIMAPAFGSPPKEKAVKTTFYDNVLTANQIAPATDIGISPAIDQKETWAVKAYIPDISVQQLAFTSGTPPAIKKEKSDATIYAIYICDDQNTSPGKIENNSLNKKEVKAAADHTGASPGIIEKNQGNKNNTGDLINDMASDIGQK